MRVWLPYIRGGSGSDTFTALLARALEEAGHDAIATRYAGFWEVAPFALAAAKPPPHTDVIVANSWNAFAFCRPPLPLVAVEHHCVFDPAYLPYRGPQQALYHELLIRRFERASFRLAAAIVGVSAHTTQVVSAVFPWTRPTCILNGIDTEYFSPALQRRRRPGRPFRLLFVGNLTRRKGADLLPRIMSALGAGFELRYTSGLRSESALETLPNMRPLGQLSRDVLREEYRSADALLFPSRLEGFGYAVAEALSCGCPVVASDSSSLPELIDDGATGRLCRCDDEGSFVRAIRDMAGNPESVATMGAAARKAAVKRFGLGRMSREYASLLKDLVDEARLPD